MVLRLHLRPEPPPDRASVNASSARVLLLVTTVPSIFHLHPLNFPINLFLVPNNHSQMETTTTLNPTEKFFLHTEWTDEKHSLYLKCMEATFVNQLYASTDLIGLHLRTKNLLDQNSSRQMHCNTSNLFGQFKVCYRRTDPQLNKEDNFYNPMENPWNRNCRPRYKLQAVADPALQETAESMDSRSQALQEKIISCESATSSKHLHPNHDRCCVHDSEGSENVCRKTRLVKLCSERPQSKTCYPFTDTPKLWPSMAKLVIHLLDHILLKEQKKYD